MRNYFYLLFTLALLCSCNSENTVLPAEKLQNKNLNLAYDFYDSNQLDSALIYFGKAKNELIQQKDSLRTATSLIYMAIITNDFGLYFGAQEFLIESVDYLKLGDTSQRTYLNSYYTTLGTVLNNLGQYEKSIKYFNRGIEISPNKQSTLILKNNLALSYRYAGKLEESIKIYEEFIEQSQSSREYSRALSNLTYTKWLQDPKYPAEQDLLKALKIRQESQDILGQIASNKHLSDYHTTKNPNSAKRYAQQMLQLSEEVGAINDKSEALLKLAKLNTGKKSNSYFKEYIQVTDSVKLINDRHRNQFALVKYESERYKNERNELEQDNIKKKNQLLVNNIILIGTILLGALILIIGWLWSKRRAIKIETESREKIKQSQLQTSKRVHDVVANGLYRLMSDLENNDQLQKEAVLDSLESMYEKSRDISYEESAYINKKYKETLRNICQSFSNEQVKVVLLGNDENLWNTVSSSIKFEFEHILQELLVNMKKHSEATNVLIKFEKYQGGVFFTYTDNGIGFTGETTYKNGLNNTVTRTNSINGIINFDMEIENGAKITIQFPSK